MATICCAITSSGGSGMTSVSRSPRRIASTRAAHSTSSSQVVGKRRPFGMAAAPVAGASDALKRHGNRSRRSDLAHQVDRADVDAQFEGGGGDEHPQIARLEARFGVEARLPGQAAVMRGHDARAQSLRQVVAQPLRQPSGVDEDEGRTMLADERRDAARRSPPTARAWPRRQARRQAPRSPGRADASASPVRRSARDVPRRRGTARRGRSASASRTGRCG